MLFLGVIYFNIRMSWNFVEKDAQLSLEVEKNQNEIAALRKQVNSLQTELGSTKVKIS